MEFIATKWTATAASIWIQCATGASYTFGIYSPILKSSQGYSQSNLNTVSVFKDIGANIGILSGLLLSACPDRPWIVILAGAVQCFFGYFMIWASVIGLVGKPSLWLMCFYMLVAAHAQTFFNTANVVTGVRNFADYSGTIVGISKGFLGLSGAILIQLYESVCQGNPTSYILLLALVPALTSLLLMNLVRAHPCRDAIGAGGVKKYLNEYSAVALTVAAYLTFLIIYHNIFTVPSWLTSITFSLMFLFITISPVSIAIRAHREESNKLSLATTPVSYTALPQDQDPHEIVDDHNLLQALASLNFWLLFSIMFCALGSGVATVNNISQIGESLHYKTVEISSLVSLWSIWNFLGRFGAGYISDFLLHQSGVPRPILMVVTLAFMAAGYVVIASGFQGNLYLGSIMVGIAYGSQWSLMPTISSEIFGVTHLGTIFNTIPIATPLGSYIFSVKVIGNMYDKAAAAGGGGRCYGTKCFFGSFLILACVAIFGCVLAFVLFFRTRRFYSRV